jgi:cell division protein FtsI/penicillin-binding protein 2
MIRGTAVLSLVGLSALALASCTADDGLADAVADLQEAAQSHEYADDALADFPLTVTAGEPVKDGETATVDLSFDWDIEGNEWAYTVPVTLDGWSVEETPDLAGLGLAEGETIEVSRVYPDRADILGAGGETIVTDREVSVFGLDKSWVDADQVADSAEKIATALGIDAEEFVGRAEQMGEQAFVEAITLRPADAAERVPDDFTDIPGANSVEKTMTLAPTRMFARDLLGSVGEATAEIIDASDGAISAGDQVGLSGLQKARDTELRGTPTITLSAVSGDDSRELISFEGAEADPLTTTLDIELQNRADKVLAGVDGTASIVAIRPSTGGILAAANTESSAIFANATDGQYAPGSTFKVVTALALLRAGATPDDTVTCSDTLTVDGYEFHNFPDYPEGKTGDISLRDAIANSCNTAMVAQAEKIDDAALQDAAASLGLGGTSEIGAFTGSVPDSASKTEHAADLIGQGRVLASPLAMATVAASIAAGETVAPHVVEASAPETDATAAPEASADPVATSAPADGAAPLTAEEAATLAELMRGVVTDGSGTELKDLDPAVGAKTGTAEFVDPDGELATHGWMIAMQGDLAVAVFVDDGTGSGTAAPLVKELLQE